MYWAKRPAKRTAAGETFGTRARNRVTPRFAYRDAIQPATTDSTASRAAHQVIGVARNSLKSITSG